jgi:hypothetical protein
MAHQDDPRIAGDLRLYRRIPPKGDRVSWDGDQPTPASQNFRDREDELSVYIADETTPEAVLSGHEGFGLVEFTAGQVRELFGQDVILCRDPEDPANGHVLICGKITNGMSKKLKAVVKWVEGRLPQRLPPDEW